MAVQAVVGHAGGLAVVALGAALLRGDVDVAGEMARVDRIVALRAGLRLMLGVVERPVTQPAVEDHGLGDGGRHVRARRADLVAERATGKKRVVCAAPRGLAVERAGARGVMLLAVENFLQQDRAELIDLLRGDTVGIGEFVHRVGRQRGRLGGWSCCSS